ILFRSAGGSSRQEGRQFADIGLFRPGEISLACHRTAAAWPALAWLARFALGSFGSRRLVTGLSRRRGLNRRSGVNLDPLGPDWPLPALLPFAFGPLTRRPLFARLRRLAALGLLITVALAILRLRLGLWLGGGEARV